MSVGWRGERPRCCCESSFMHSDQQPPELWLRGLELSHSPAVPWKDSAEGTWHFSALFQFTQAQVTMQATS